MQPQQAPEQAVLGAAWVQPAHPGLTTEDVDLGRVDAELPELTEGLLHAGFLVDECMG